MKLPLPDHQGNAILFVTIISLYVFTMVLVSLTLSNNQAKVARSYQKAASTNLLAASGMEEALVLLDNMLALHYDEIYSATISAIKAKNIDDISMYVWPNRGDVYAGDYHLKAKDSSGVPGKRDILFGDLFAEKALSFIRTEINRLPKKPTASDYTYSYTVTDGSDADPYYINSLYEFRKPSPPPRDYPYFSTITVSAIKGQSLRTYAKSDVQIQYACDGEYIEERYAWRDKPPQYAAGLCTVYSLQVQSGEINAPDYTSIGDLTINTGILKQNMAWQEANPIVYIQSGADVQDIDVSSFYNKDGPVKTIIIDARQNGRMSLHATDPTKNQFCGLLLSNGIVTASDTAIDFYGGVAIRGGLYAEDMPPASLVTNAAVLHFAYDENAIFDARFADKALYRRVLDTLNITNYRGVTKEDNDKDDIRAITNHAKLSNDYNIKIMLRDKLRFGVPPRS